MTIELILSDGKISFIDDEKFDLVSKYSWNCSTRKTRSYAHTTVKGVSIYLNRLIVESEGIIIGKLDVHHKDHNTLNNVKSNLVIATRSQNIAHQGIRETNSSGYKGVYWCSWTNKWRADIVYQCTKIHLGRFVNIKDAARAYNRAAKMYFKEFAWLNEID